MYEENEFIELKRELTQDIKKEIIAFANTNGGTIYVGIEDNGKIIGLKNSAQDLEAISGMIREGIKPDLTLLTKIYIESIEEKKVLIINITEGLSKPYYLSEKGMKSNGVFVRHGTSSVPTSDENIKKLLSENNNSLFEKSVSKVQNLNLDYAYSIFKEKGITIDTSKEKTLNITNNDDLYTNLGLLLSDECQFIIKCAIYNGTDKIEFKDRREFSGSVLKQMVDCFEYLSMFNRTKGKIVGLDRIDIKDYPDYALRETVLNAIIHRDYNFQGSILIHMFDDRIEILSLGGLVKGISLNDILMGVSEPRNPNLANVFFRLNYVESFGTGIDRIVKSYEKYNKFPQFKNSNNGFLVILPNINYMELAKNKTNINIYSQEELILNYVKKYGSITRIVAQDILKTGRTRTGNIINKLLESGMLIKEGIGKNTRYKLNP